MATLPIRRSGRNGNPNASRELEDIYDRMGQLMSFPFGDLSAPGLAGLPWTDASRPRRIEITG